MPATTCTSATLVSAANCFQNYSNHDKDAIQLYIMAHIIGNSLGGTDYTQTLSTTMLSDAQTLTADMTSEQRRDAELAIWFNLSNGAITESSLPTVISCLKNATQDQLDRAKLLLMCKFNAGIFSLVNV